MKITILTLFPEMFTSFLSTSIIKRAIEKKKIYFSIVNIRDYTEDKYHRVDTPPIGGGAGLVMKVQPIVTALQNDDCLNSHKILLSPKGSLYTQQKAQSLIKFEHITLICGHYEGVDERVNHYVDETISIGDYILTGGEIPSMVIADSLTRLIEGAIESISLIEESFNNGLLEYPQYTEPHSFNNHSVPDILYSGNHQAINKWRHKQSLKITRINRPDLFLKYKLTGEDKILLSEIDSDSMSQWEKLAIIKSKKFMKTKENK
jgi:tRNA (guanine37-N1)-methyltransferase